MSSDHKFNIHEAKTQFSQLVARAERGEEIIIARAGVPVARLVTLQAPAQKRVPGRLRGYFEVSGDFDAALPDEVLGGFEG